MQTTEMNKNGVLLVLMDLKEGAYVSLKYAITLAKRSRFDLKLFHVLPALDVIKSDNQLVGIAKLETERARAEENFEAIVEIITAEGLFATYELSFGAVHSEIRNQIKLCNPELIVAGRNKNRTQSVGATTRFLLKCFHGPILSVVGRSEFKQDTKICLAGTESLEQEFNLDTTFKVSECTKAPLYVLKVQKKDEGNEPMRFKTETGYPRTIHQILTHDSKKPSDLAKQLCVHGSQEGVDLLCVGNDVRFQGQIT
ncbi:MAG: universal stress protein, partial [Flavobacteriales bacterium]|nr:universal stress protein [Flavobacteriales bacterium]